MKIIYDAFGGDNAPLEIIKGAIMSKKELDINVILCGDKDIITKNLEELHENINDYEILDAKSKIENDEEPVMAIRKKKDSSIVVGMKYLAEGNADGIISAGNTGALLAAGLFIVKKIPGIERAPIATLIPTKEKPFLLIDTGANMDTTPELLNQFSVMGSIYLEKALGINSPTVGLINVGKEDGKGNNLYKKTFELLKENKDINFKGNYEPRELPFGGIDIIVADGFDGNVFLKTYEGTASMIMSMLKENSINIEDPNSQNDLKKLMYQTFARFEYSDLGGAPLLGLTKPVFKAHGISDAEAILGASKQIKNFVENKVIETISKHF